jgi:hypothetical protein
MLVITTPDTLDARQMIATAGCSIPHQTVVRTHSEAEARLMAGRPGSVQDERVAVFLSERNWPTRHGAACCRAFPAISCAGAH